MCGCVYADVGRSVPVPVSVPSVVLRVSVSCTLGASGNMLGEYVYLQISPLKLCAATPAPAPQLLGSVLCTRNIVGVDLVVFVLRCFRSATTFSSLSFYSGWSVLCAFSPFASAPRRSVLCLYLSL